ncbi:MAG: BA14K family protein [Pseudomonadota bacterium]
MRIIAALALLITAGAWAPVVHAADLHVLQNGYYAPITTSRYFGKFEPWSRRAERPPRKGLYQRNDPVSRTVNPVIPMRSPYARPTPWTPAWEAWCAARWPSFNPRTGTVQTPDGQRMCL